MADLESVRAHYDSLETDVLLDHWRRGGQLDWAEQLLRSELVARGITEAELDGMADERQAHAVERQQHQEMFDFGIWGPFVAVLLCLMLGTFMRAVFGFRAAAETVAWIAFVYAMLSVKHAIYLHRNLPEGLPRVYLLSRKVIELLVVAVVIFFAALLAFGYI